MQNWQQKHFSAKNEAAPFVECHASYFESQETAQGIDFLFGTSPEPDNFSSFNGRL